MAGIPGIAGIAGIAGMAGISRMAAGTTGIPGIPGIAGIWRMLDIPRIARVWGEVSHLVFGFIGLWFRGLGV